MKNPRINVSFDKETYEQIRKLAAKEGRSASDLVREYALQGLSGTVNVENISIITEIIRKELQSVLVAPVNRLAALSAKTCVQAGTAAYLSAEAIARFVPAEQSLDVQTAYEAARVKSIAYTKNSAELD